MHMVVCQVRPALRPAARRDARARGRPDWGALPRRHWSRAQGTRKGLVGCVRGIWLTHRRIRTTTEAGLVTGARGAPHAGARDGREGRGGAGHGGVAVMDRGVDESNGLDGDGESIE